MVLKRDMSLNILSINVNGSYIRYKKDMIPIGWTRPTPMRLSHPFNSLYPLMIIDTISSWNAKCRIPFLCKRKGKQQC